MIAIPLADAGIEMVAIDTSSDMLDVFRSRLPDGMHLPLIQADIQALPFHDAAFGSALVANVFHLVPDWKRAMRELSRVLRPQRRLLVNLGGAGSYPDDLLRIERTFRALASPGQTAGTHASGPRDAEEFDDQAAILGFESLPLLEVEYTEQLTPESVIQRLEQNVFAWPQDVTGDSIQHAAERTRAWTRKEIGPLDRPYSRYQRIVYRCYR